VKQGDSAAKCELLCSQEQGERHCLALFYVCSQWPSNHKQVPSSEQ
jgi:hypothetical protein